MEFKMYTLLTAFIIIGSGCDVVSSKPMFGERVREAAPQEFPYVVSIRRVSHYNQEPEQNHICTGVLVSSRDVVTVEHCFRHLRIPNIEVVIGSNDLREGIPYQISWWISYYEWILLENKFLEYQNNEIAVIRINNSIPNHIYPALLSTAMNIGNQQEQIRIVGFGKSNRGVINRMMETVELTLISRRECENRISRLQDEMFYITEQYLCGTSNSITIINEGNSGSAILLNNELIGIQLASYPPHLNEYDPLKLNIFLSIDYYGHFLNDIIYNH